MFRPYYRIHTPAEKGTHFEKQDILQPLKEFLDRHDIPSEIVNDVSFWGNNIYVKLRKGSIDEYCIQINTALKPLRSSKYSYSLRDKSATEDVLSCWAPFIEDIVEANNKHKLGIGHIEPLRIEEPERKMQKIGEQLTALFGSECHLEIYSEKGFNYEVKFSSAQSHMTLDTYLDQLVDVGGFAIHSEDNIHRLLCRKSPDYLLESLDYLEHLKSSPSI